MIRTLCNHKWEDRVPLDIKYKDLKTKKTVRIIFSCGKCQDTFYEDTTVFKKNPQSSRSVGE